MGKECEQAVQKCKWLLNTVPHLVREITNENCIEISIRRAKQALVLLMRV